jgi:hypothetical protein
MKKEKTVIKSWSIPALIVRHPVVAAISIALSTSLAIIVQLMIEPHRELLRHEIAVVVLAACLPFIASYIHKKILLLKPVIEDITDNDNSEIREFQIGQEQIMYNHWAAYLLPIVFAVLALKSIMALGTVWGNIIAANAYNFLIGLLLVLSASIGWYFFIFLVYLRNVRQLKIIGEPFFWPQKCFHQMAKLSLDVFYVGATIYLGAIFTVWLIPWGNFMLFSSSFSYLWVIPLAIAVITYFLAGQYLLHQIIKTSKDQRIEKIDHILGQTYNRWDTNPSDEKIKIISEIIKWREIVVNSSDWPIKIGVNVAIISGLLAPVVGAMAEYAIRRI